MTIIFETDMKKNAHFSRGVSLYTTYDKTHNLS